MNENVSFEPPRPYSAETSTDSATEGMSSLYKLFEAFISLREKNERQHRLFEQSQNRSRDTLIEKFNSFAADTQRAFQNLRQELTGEKRLAVAILNELVDLSLELKHIVETKPSTPANTEMDAMWQRWAEAVEIQSRKVEAALVRHGIQPYHAVIGSAYDPSLHERVGGKRMEGMDALRVAEQKEPGYASQMPEFVLRRPKIIVSE